MGLIYFVYCHTPLIKNVITLYDLAKGKKYEIGGKKFNFVSISLHYKATWTSATIHDTQLCTMGIISLAYRNTPPTENVILFHDLTQ